MRISLLTTLSLSFPLLTSGCFYIGPIPTVSKGDTGPWDTAVDQDDVVADESALDEMPYFTGSGAACNSETPSRVEYTSDTLTYAAALVVDATIDPGSGNSNVSFSHSGNTNGATDAAPRDLYGSAEWAHGVGTGDADDGTMFNCGPDSSGTTDPGACSGLYRLTVAPTPSGLVQCAELGVPKLSLTTTHRTPAVYRPNAECEDGEGTFALYAISRKDADGDGRGRYVMRAIQVAGEGVMTSRSSVTSIAVVSAPTTIRVIKPNKTYSFGSDDSLTSASTNSVALSGTTNFDPGDIVGNPDFVVVEPANTDMGRFFVDIEWECESTGGTSLSAPQGYKVSLADIGLVAPQKLTMRPRFNVNPKRIEWELYGDPRARFATPVQQTLEGHAFDFHWGRFEMSGVVLSTNSTSASVRLDELKFDGDNYGELDTYTLPAE
jgi:hypothetical protein